MRKFSTGIIAIGALGLGLGLFLTAPVPVDASFGSGHTPDLAKGRDVFNAGGCASCHAAPGAKGDDKLVLAGGHAFASDFGTFYAPNISSDPQAGIGGWDLPSFARAVTQGVSPAGEHYYPAFPYTSYVHMTDKEVVDLFAYMQSLPADPTPDQPHDVGFPFNIRLSLGGWKLLFARDDYVLAGDLTPVLERGRYLVEGLAHCGECHTARNALGGQLRGQWLAGAPNPSGKGKIPNITPGALEWSEDEIAEYLSSGFTPEFDSAGGEMVAVIENMAKLPESDRLAIAAYLKAVPALP